MKYNSIIKGIFIERPNRFTAICKIDDITTKVHVKNTGRCRELLIPGTTVFLEKAASPTRKTLFSLIAVMKGNRLINIDSQAPNKVVFEALQSGAIDLGLGKIINITPEVKYGSSRFDFYAETLKSKIFIEVKGVTLEKNNIAMFPDAPTERGLKHIKELTNALSQGYNTFIIFVIQMTDLNYFTPNKETHLDFAIALNNAVKQGVKVFAYDCNVYESEIGIRNTVKILL